MTSIEVIVVIVTPMSVCFFVCLPVHLSESDRHASGLCKKREKKLSNVPKIIITLPDSLLLQLGRDVSLSISDAVFNAKFRGKDTIYPEKSISSTTFWTAVSKQLQITGKFRQLYQNRLEFSIQTNPEPVLRV
jgi:hypothetical protein